MRSLATKFIQPLKRITSVVKLTNTGPPRLLEGLADVTRGRAVGIEVFETAQERQQGSAVRVDNFDQLLEAAVAISRAGLGFR